MNSPILRKDTHATNALDEYAFAPLILRLDLLSVLLGYPFFCVSFLLLSFCQHAWPGANPHANLASSGLCCITRTSPIIIITTVLRRRSPQREDASGLRRPPLDKLLQVAPGGDAQDEPPVVVGDDGELLLLALGLRALEEGLELLERRVHRDDPVLPAPALEPRHGGADGVLRGDLAAVQLGLQVRDRHVAQQAAGLAVDDRQVRVVALEGGLEGEGDGVRGREGEGCGRLEVFYCGLMRAEGVSSMVSLSVCRCELSGAVLVSHDLPRGTGLPTLRRTGPSWPACCW